MNTYLYIFQILSALVVITLVVLQSKGTGLGRAFASNNYHAKRGAEKTVFVATILTSILFLTLSVIVNI